ncbi:phosphoserine transaminase [Gleimia hominis]|uniref:phosphoserine transaminase n=1 Tax=Gleimia hominis TaxID=595468 RepID=A0ABU3ICB3_9ACTO|nr:phosphoserine transaminase [Gleimia hominis]MDT3768013.1 phosphoserine transaminase [Gleimia hominis]
MEHTVSSPVIPPHLLPADGRFGAGPSKVRAESIAQIGACGLMGTSHRQAPVRSLVAQIREMVRDLFALPADYEVVLGNGGATAFWAVACTSLIRRRSVFATFGEFGFKFYDEARRTPFLDVPARFDAPAGQLATVEPVEGADVYAWPHHETSTGVLAPVRRPVGAEGALVLVDATSVAGAVVVDVGQTDAYYFSPQKAFGSDGGLWVAALSPAAIERAAQLERLTDRWMPQFLNLNLAVRNARKDQTVNTPALATLVMLHAQLEWMLDAGGLQACFQRVKTSTDAIYEWAQNRPFTTPFVADEALRSPVVATIDFEGVDAAQVARVLRANGVVDVEPYRKLGRNQLRISTFPAVDPADVTALLKCIDWVVDNVSSTRAGQ